MEERKGKVGKKRTSECKKDKREIKRRGEGRK